MLNDSTRGKLKRLGNSAVADCMAAVDVRVYGPSVNKEYLSQIQLYLTFGELPVLSNTVLIITVCVKVANSTFLVTKWAQLSRYYLCNCFVR